MKKLLIALMASLLMPAMAYADVNADKPILIETQDCSEAIEAVRKEFAQGGMGDTLARFNGNDIVIGTPFAVECTDDKNRCDCYYLFPVINNGVITGAIDVEKNDNDDMYVASVSQSGFITGDDESCWNELKDGKAYIIHRDEDTGRIFATSGDKNVLLSIDYGENKPIPAPIEAERTVVDITRSLDIKAETRLTDEEIDIWKNARDKGKTVMTMDADESGAVNINNRLLIPLRDVGEAMNCEVEWRAETKTAVVKGDKNVEFTINRPFYTIDGELYDTDASAMLIEGRTYIPLRAVSEALGADIAYNTESGIITLSF